MTDRRASAPTSGVAGTTGGRAARVVTVAASFTATPVQNPLGYWWSQLDLPVRTVMAPYAQLVQPLLQHADTGQADAVVVLLRWEDLVRFSPMKSDPDRATCRGGPTRTSKPSPSRSTTGPVRSLAGRHRPRSSPSSYAHYNSPVLQRLIELAESTTTTEDPHHLRNFGDRDCGSSKIGGT
jgi:hypothetical protein